MSFHYEYPDTEEMQPVEDYPDDYGNSPGYHDYTPPKERHYSKDSFNYNLPPSQPQPTDKIMSRVLDEDLSVYSPSRRKRLRMLQHQMSLSKEPEQLTRGSLDRQTASKFANYHQESVPFFEKSEQLKHNLEELKSTEDFRGIDELSIEEKVMKYVNCLSNPSKQVKLAGLQGLFDSIEELNQSLTEVVLDEVLNSLETWEEEDPEFVECALDIVGTIGEHPFSVERLALLSTMVYHDETSEFKQIHEGAFSCLCRLGLPGFDALIRLASRDFPYFQHWLLENLATSHVIQRSIIVPALAQDALSPDSNLRTQAVAALNRMYSVVWEGGALPVLLTLMEEGSVDRQLVACTIRSAGQIGEQTLIKLLKQSENPKIRMASASSLCWRVPTRPKQLEMRIVTDTMLYEEHRFPGAIVNYIGPLCPVLLQEEAEEAILEINGRDFLASMQRWIRRESEGDLGDVFPNLPAMPQATDPDNEEDAVISLQAIGALCSALRDGFEGVRETATYALGFIGLPEAVDAVNPLSKLLRDSSPQVRTMACWAIGRLGTSAWRAGPALIELLKDGYWKVRTAACISLASAGQNIAGKAIPVLHKILKDGSINRATVAETIVRLGPQGERLLLDMLNHEPHTNTSLRVGAVKSFAQANVFHNNIDFVVETLFKLSGDRLSNVRNEVLNSLNLLTERANNQVTYLKPRTVLPLYFRMLRDSSKEVRATAIRCIVNIGPQGQLMLIEALTKDQNPQMRAQAARGLGMFGPCTFRSLLLGLHDSHPSVRKATASTIARFSPEAISDEFWERVPQRQSIKCAIKEILALPYSLPGLCGNLLKEILTMLTNEFSQGGRGHQYMDSHPEIHIPKYSTEDA